MPAAVAGSDPGDGNEVKRPSAFSHPSMCAWRRKAEWPGGTRWPVCHVRCSLHQCPREPPQRCFIAIVTDHELRAIEIMPFFGCADERGEVVPLRQGSLDDRTSGSANRLGNQYCSRRIRNEFVLKSIRDCVFEERSTHCPPHRVVFELLLILAERK